MPDQDDTFYTFEPIVGYRGWEWSGRRLVGAVTEWQTAFMKARHIDHMGSEPHLAPDWGCRCGVNVYKDVYDARGFPILGKVELSGLVIEFERGYRGQFGEIIEIAFDETFMPEADMVKVLGDIYKVPVKRLEYMPWRK